ncbi:hypothetical protein [Magnetospirillum sp. 15-1]|uniref:hypothetical protein n=1 Tax=Magnetospirillum sp. 15-1 TaxID=1979370 RepID=UPI000BBCF819|nr:hypothetical protein [Magnetospirillum sp. 15-1]
MASPLQGGIARTIGKALAGVMYGVTLSRTTEGYYDPDTGTVVPGATETFTAKGMVDNWGAYHLANQLVQAGDRKVTILTPSLSTTPAAGDSVTANGQSWLVISIQSDPAKAVWVLQAR